jgi:murein DD-endopeptidase MepM/ murein hydrolase activator NlpD
VLRHPIFRATALILMAWLVTGCSLVASLSPTATPEPTATATATPSPTATPTATPTPSPTPTPIPLRADVTLSGGQARQGHTTVVRVVTNRPAQVSGVLGESPLNFVSRDGLEHIALLGVHALADLAPQSLELDIIGDEGQELTLGTVLHVAAGDFEYESITFTPEVGALLDPAISQPELLRVTEIYATFSPEIRWEGLFDRPYIGRVSSQFGTRRAYDGTIQSYHAGIDLAGELGSEVLAPAPGKVVLAEMLQVRGGTVIIDHGAGVLSALHHLDSIEVEEGQMVAQGERVGRLGSTGLSTGPHLHWELRVGGVAVNPQEWTEQAFP